MRFCLYHLPNSRSQRVVWLLECLQVEYELQICPRDNNNQAMQSLKNIHPLGKVPILQVYQDDKLMTLAETTAIVDFLATHYANHPLFYVDDILNYCYYKNFSDGSLIPMLALKQVFARLVAFTPWFVRPVVRIIKHQTDKHYINPSLTDYLVLINTHLKNRQFFIDNHLTAVDILMEFMLSALTISVPNFDEYHNINSYLSNIYALPSYQRAKQKGGFDEKVFAGYWQSAW